jgi:THO complex subunit 4
VPTRPAQARAAADSPYGVYSEHIATIAAVAPPPPAATARLLETGTKLHISNLDSGVTVEDVQVLPMLLLLGNSLSNLAIASVLLCYLKDIGSLFL